MVTNVTISPIDGPTVVYAQDGSSTTVDSGETASFQIIEEGFITISDAGSDSDDAEHPPQDPPEWFVNAMEKFADLMRQAIQDPEVTPHE